MNRHNRKGSEWSSSHSSSCLPSRSASYVQSELDRAYQDLLFFVRCEDLLERYENLDDEDRPLANVWEGMDGYMQHVPEKFPMPERALEKCKPQCDPKEKDKSTLKRPLEKSDTDAAVTKKTRKEGQSDVSNSQKDVTAGSREDASFLVLDSCGELDVEVDDIGLAFGDDEDEPWAVGDSPPEPQDEGDLILALATEDSNEAGLDDLPVASAASPVAESSGAILKTESVDVNSHGVKVADDVSLSVKQIPKGLAVADTQHTVSHKERSVDTDSLNVKQNSHKVASATTISQNVKQDSMSRTAGTTYLGVKQDSHKVASASTISQNVKQDSMSRTAGTTYLGAKQDSHKVGSASTISQNVKPNSMSQTAGTTYLGVKQDSHKVGSASTISQNVKQDSMSRTAGTTYLGAKQDSHKVASASTISQNVKQDSMSQTAGTTYLGVKQDSHHKVQPAGHTISPSVKHSPQSKVSADSDALSTSAKLDSHKIVLVDSAPLSVKHRPPERVKLERIFYEPCTSSDNKSGMSKNNIYKNLAVFDEAVNVIGKRIGIIKCGFLRNTRMNLTIGNNDLLKVSELISLVVGLFAEMEILRVTQDPSNTLNLFLIPPTSGISERDRKSFLAWYRTINEKVERCIAQISNFLDEYRNKIFQFNTSYRVRDNWVIRVPKLPYFTKDQRLTRFINGVLEIYRVTPFLMETVGYMYDDDILSSDSREVLWGPGTLYSELDITTFPLETISEVERIFYRPTTDCAMDYKCLQRQFIAFEDATNTLSECMDTTIKVFGRKSDSDINDSDLLKVSELGCLAVALFSEIEVLRVTQNPKNTYKKFCFPASCQLSSQRQQMFINWYTDLRKKSEDLKNMFTQLLAFNKSLIYEFNRKAGFKGATCIRVPGMHFFTKAKRFSNFQNGALKVYRISPLLSKQVSYEDSIVNPAVRQTLSGHGTVYAEQPVVNAKPEGNHSRGRQSDVTVRSGDHQITISEMQKSEVSLFEPLGHSVDEDSSMDICYDAEVKNSEIIRQRASGISADSGEMQKFCQQQSLTNKDCDAKLDKISLYGAKSSQPASHSHSAQHPQRQVCEEDDGVWLPVDCENSYKPPDDTATILNHDEILDSWKKTLKKIRKRLFFLENKLTKNNPEEEVVKVCIEMARHSNSITDLNDQFKEFQSSAQTATSPVDINQMNQLELSLRLLHGGWRKVYFSNLKTFQCFNKSEAAKQNGLVIPPKKLEKLSSGPPKTTCSDVSGNAMRSSENEDEWHDKRPVSGLRMPSDPHCYPHYQRAHHKPYNEHSPAEFGQHFTQVPPASATSGVTASASVSVGQTLYPPPLPPFIQSSSAQHNQQQINSDHQSESPHFTPWGHRPLHSAGYSDPLEDHYPSGHNQQNFSASKFGDYTNHLAEISFSSYGEGSWAGHCLEQDTYQTSWNNGYAPGGGVSLSDHHSTTHPYNPIQRPFTGNLNEPNAGFRTLNTAPHSPQPYATHTNSLPPAKASQGENKISEPFEDNSKSFGSWLQSNTSSDVQSHLIPVNVNLYKYKRFANQNYSPGPSVAPQVGATPVPFSGNAPSALMLSGCASNAPSHGRFCGPAGDAPSTSRFQDPISDGNTSDRNQFHNSPRAGHSADPAESIKTNCLCAYSCGGTRLKGFPTMPGPQQDTSPEATHRLKLSLLSQDLEKIQLMQNQAVKLFDKFVKESHKKAAKIYLDVSATLPHLSEHVHELRAEHQRHRFPEKMSWFGGHSLETVEGALRNAFLRNAEIYRQRKLLILRYHHHAETFRAARNIGCTRLKGKPNHIQYRRN